MLPCSDGIWWRAVNPRPDCSRQTHRKHDALAAGEHLYIRILVRNRAKIERSLCHEPYAFTCRPPGPRIHPLLTNSTRCHAPLAGSLPPRPWPRPWTRELPSLSPPCWPRHWHSSSPSGRRGRGRQEATAVETPKSRQLHTLHYLLLLIGDSFETFR